MHIELLKSRVRDFLTGKANERKKLPVRWSHCNNARKRWTDKDIDNLVLRRARAEPWQHISEELGWSVSACKQKYHRQIKDEKARFRCVDMKDLFFQVLQRCRCENDGRGCSVGSQWRAWFCLR